MTLSKSEIWSMGSGKYICESGDKVIKGQILVEIKNNKLRDHIDKLINTKSILLNQGIANRPKIKCCRNVYHY